MNLSWQPSQQQLEQIRNAVNTVNAEQEAKKNPIKVGVGDADAAQKRLDQIQTIQSGDPKEAERIKKNMTDAESARLNREIDMARGMERGEQLFGEGSLGRIGEERSADIADIVNRRNHN